ncbi:beta strand repeat-containing protein [Deinococcus hohokamensis]|uniref:Beta strand repeat-containing protein n=1 Tax=Deinococcus hohokamensis TaxID=309883 RepID=A0ABV9I6G0_9DEIO
MKRPVPTFPALFSLRALAVLFGRLRLPALGAVLVLLTSQAASAATLNLVFQNGVNSAGGACATTAGSVCRFRNVVVDAAGTALPATSPFQRDVLVTVVGFGGNARLSGALDDDSGTNIGAGFFAPTTDVTSTAINTDGYASFGFQFVAPGTSTPLAADGTIFITGFDIDGDSATNGLREFAEFDGAARSGLAATTNLESIAVINAGTGNVRYRVKTSAGLAGISTADTNKASAIYTNPSAFTLITGSTAGAAVCSGAACARLNAFSFQMNTSVVTASVLNGYKAAKLTTDVNADARVGTDDTVTYTVAYVNTGNAALSNFQVTDALPADVTFKGPLTVSVNGTVTAGAANTAYNGTTQTSLLATGVTLAAGGTVTISIPTTVNRTTAGTVTNQAAASGINTDNTDNTATYPPSVSAATGWSSFTGTLSGSVTQTMTSDVSPTSVTTVGAPGISGVVFEDVNYGGGAGRSRTAAGGAVRSGVRVELYTSAGAFVSATTTDAGGAFAFQTAAGPYIVRVVNSSVTSSRALNAGATTPLAVQTFRTNAGADDVNRVGGENPQLVDAAANTTGAALSTLSTTTTVAQSVAPVTAVNTAATSNVDFGFNFDTVVSTRDAGQGSLRQFILNSNTLANTGLAQVGQTAGTETSIFMIPDGAAHPGLRSGLTSQLTGGVAVITPASLLPAVTDTDTVISGLTQSTNVGDTNTGTLGTGGTVGVDALSLPTQSRPEVQLVGAGTAAAFATGLDLQASGATVRGLSIYGFGTAANANTSADIRIGASAQNVLIERNFLGIAATRPTFDCRTGTTAATGSGDLIRSLGGDNGTVQDNLIGCTAGKGIGLEAGSTGWLVTRNEIRGNGIGNSNLDGVDLEGAGSGSHTVRGNLIVNNEGVGVDSYGGQGSNTIENNSIISNGLGTAANLENAGVRVYGTGSTLRRNIITANRGSGVMVTASNGTLADATGNTITQNSIYDNTGIGIDLTASADNQSVGTAPFVTKNDTGDTDTGGNALLNFPFFTGAVIDVSGQNLTLSGFAQPGALIELFVAAPDPSNFGEGKTYLRSLTEGATTGSPDSAAGTGTYNDANAGSETTNRFTFVVPLSSLSGVGLGTKLTATATCLSSNGCAAAPNGSTSEFSLVTAVTGTPRVTLTKSVRNCGRIAPGAECTGTYGTNVTGKPGDVLEYRIEYVNVGIDSATSLVINDRVPSNSTALLSGFASGRGLSWTVGSAAPVLLTSAAGDDAGSLSATQLLLNVGTVAPGAGGSVLFRTTIQ